MKLIELLEIVNENNYVNIWDCTGLQLLDEYDGKNNIDNYYNDFGVVGFESDTNENNTINILIDYDTRKENAFNITMGISEIINETDKFFQGKKDPYGISDRLFEILTDFREITGTSDESENTKNNVDLLEIDFYDMAKQLYNQCEDMDFLNHIDEKPKNIELLKNAIAKLYKSESIEDTALYQALEIIINEF